NGLCRNAEMRRLSRHRLQLPLGQTARIAHAERRRGTVIDRLAGLPQVTSIEVGIRIADQRIHVAVGACHTRNTGYKQRRRYHNAPYNRNVAVHDCSFYLCEKWILRSAWIIK